MYPYDFNQTPTFGETSFYGVPQHNGGTYNYQPSYDPFYNQGNNYNYDSRRNLPAAPQIPAVNNYQPTQNNANPFPSPWGNAYSEQYTPAPQMPMPQQMPNTTFGSLPSYPNYDWSNISCYGYDNTSPYATKPSIYDSKASWDRPANQQMTLTPPNINWDNVYSQKAAEQYNPYANYNQPNIQNPMRPTCSWMDLAQYNWADKV